MARRTFGTALLRAPAKPLRRSGGRGQDMRELTLGEALDHLAADQAGYDDDHDGVSDRLDQIEGALTALIDVQTQRTRGAAKGVGLHSATAEDDDQEQAVLDMVSRALAKLNGGIDPATTSHTTIDTIAERLGALEGKIEKAVNGAAKASGEERSGSAADDIPIGRQAATGALKAIGQKLEELSRNADQASVRPATAASSHNPVAASVAKIESSLRAKQPAQPDIAAQIAQGLERGFAKLEERLDSLTPKSAPTPSVSEDTMDSLRASIDRMTERQGTLTEEFETLSAAQSSDMDRRFRHFTDRLENQIDEGRFGQGGPSDDKLADLSTNVRAIADKLDHSPILESAGLRDEISAIQARLDGVPHETASEFETHLDRLAQELKGARGETLDEIRGQITQIGALVDGALRAEITGLREDMARLGEKIDTSENPATARFARDLCSLADRVETIDNNHGGGIVSLRKDILALSERVDRALSIDHAPKFDAIERQLGDIAARIEARPAPEPSPKLDAIEQRIGDIVSHIEARPTLDPTPRLDDIAQRIGDIATRIDTVHGTAPDPRLASIEAQLGSLHETIASVGVAPGALDALSQQVVAISADIDSLRQADPVQAQIDLAPIEARLADLAQRLETGAAVSGDTSALTALHRQLAAITARLEDAPKSAAIDSETIKALETQIGKLADQIEQTGNIGARDLGQLETQVAGLAEKIGAAGNQIGRLGSLEGGVTALAGRIDEMRQDVMATAAKAAEQAVQKALQNAEGSTGASHELAGALKADLAFLKTAGEASSHRTETALEGVRSTLSKIVSRLADLEDEVDTIGDQSTKALPKAPVKAPPRAMAAETKLQKQPAAGPLPSSMLVPDMVADRAPEPTSDSAGDTANKPRRKWGLGRSKKTEDSPPLAPPPAGGDDFKSSIELLEAADRGDTAFIDDDATIPPPVEGVAADTPLRPGSRQPYGGKFADEPKPTKPRAAVSDAQADGDPKDFLAAAREAARQARADSVTEDPGLDVEPQKSGLFKTLGKYRRTLLIGTAVVLFIIGSIRLAGMILGPDGADTAMAPLPPVAEETVAGDVDPVSEIGADETPEAVTGDTEVSGPALDARPDTETAPRQIVTPPQPAEPAAAATDTVSETGDTLITNSIPEVSPAEALPDITSEMIGASLDLATLPAEIGPDALREAAEAGDVEAQFEVATRFMDGRGVTQDFAKAVAWYQAAAAQEFPPAQHRLASMYERGRGIERDPGMALLWYTRAADAGNRNAMHNLAVMNAQGALGEPDYPSALHWFVEAADRGLRDSQFNVAILYARGLGIERDLVEAYKWLAIAAATGDTEAASKRDEIAAELDSETLSQARAAVDAWRPKPIDEAANVVTRAPASWGETAAIPQLDGPQLVSAAQYLLNRLGFDAGPADGLVGPRTRDAVRAFQTQQGLPETGQITQELIEALSGSAS
ncbi:MAG: peptidoglycan-binding protein [Pseudomonadota bacterium]